MNLSPLRNREPHERPPAWVPETRCHRLTHAIEDIVIPLFQAAFIALAWRTDKDAIFFGLIGRGACWLVITPTLHLLKKANTCSDKNFYHVLRDLMVGVGGVGCMFVATLTHQTSKKIPTLVVATCAGVGYFVVTRLYRNIALRFS